MKYDLNQMAMITGLTTRTLRNYMKLGFLNGEKEDGVWRFSAEDLDSFLSNSAVKQAMKAKNNAVVYDFMADAYKKANRICIILDMPVDTLEAQETANFFCGRVNRGHDLDFRFSYERGLARYILSGAEDQVSDIMREYYGKNR